MQYSEYLEKSGLSNREVVAILNPHFPKFTKIQCSMLTHPEDYGMQLTREAQTKLPPLAKKKVPKRAKPNRLVVYLDDELYKQVLAAKGEASTQEYLSALIESAETHIKE